MTTVPDRLRTPARWAGVFALVALYYWLAVSGASDKSVTMDELAHLTAGYAYDALGDFRLQPENGNWPQRWAALPAALGGAHFPAFDDRNWHISDVWNVGDRFLFGSGNDARAVTARGRAMIALLGAALGVIVFVWSRRLTSPLGAWISLALFAFSPTMLAHGALMTSDMSAALFFTAAAGCIWIVLHRVTPATVLLSAVVTAGLFLSKYSAGIIAPIAGAMALVRAFNRAPLVVSIGRRRWEVATRGPQALALLAAAAVHLVVIWALIWASYGFHNSAFAAGTDGTDRFMMMWQTLEPQTSPLALAFVHWARAHALLPEAYLYGFAHTLRFAAERPSFLNGEFSMVGSPWFFPYAFLVKTTIPLMLLLAASLFAAARRTQAKGAYAAAPLLLLVSLYGLFALNTALNIGHRHLLPIYPALFILAGGSAFWIERLTSPREAAPVKPAPGKRARKAARSTPASSISPLGTAARVAAGIVAILVGWHVVESWRIRPHYLAYFNELAGGPAEGYRHLVDSSLDWGQDLPGLARWLDDHHAGPGNTTRVYLSYFGSARPAAYGVRATMLPSFIDRRTRGQQDRLTGGYYCVSATMLQSVYLLAPGPWTPDYEAQYQQVLAATMAWDAVAGQPAQQARLIAERGENFWSQTAAYWDQFRLARLNARLRRMEPEARIGYSIFVYRLTDEQVNDALFGPPPY